MKIPKNHHWTGKRSGALPCLVALVVCSLAAGCGKKKRQSEYPNVLIITIDTLRADRLGVYGNRDGLTPNIDALARDGVSFEHAISQVPLTWPSHAAIFTGTYPFHNGVQDFTGQPLSEKFRTLAESFRASGYATGAVVSSFVLDRSWGLARGFESYDDAFSGQQFVEKDLGLVERRADASVDQAIRWLSGGTQKPFFFWLHLYDPHSPYDPPEPYATKFKSQPYDGEVAFADAQLARLFAWMKQGPHDVYANTVIVLLSDHGESLGEHGEKEHGFFVYNSTVHVPLIVKPAQNEKIAVNREIAPAVEALQVGPTVLELAGIHDAIQKQFEAGSLVPFLTGQRTNGERSAFSETTYPLNSFGWSALRSVQTEKLQFIDAPERELYDLESDPQEKTNLAEKDATTSARMRNEVNNRITQYKAAASDTNAAGASPEVLDKLRSLGYVAYKAPTAPGSTLADPKSKLHVYQDILRATDLMHAAKFNEAQALLGGIERTEPGLYLIPFLRGEAAERSQQWNTAERQFGKALQINPGFEQATLGLARALGYQGKTQQATELLRSVLAGNNKDFRAWFLLAQIESKNDSRASREALNKVLEIQPNFALAYRERGMLSVAQQDYRSGAEDLGQAVTMGVADAGTYNFLGICYSRLGRLNDAIAAYQKALAADPKLAQAHLNLGFAQERMGQSDQARVQYREACRLDRRLCAMVAGRLK